MAQEQKYDIFISYRKDDTREKVELIYSSLEDFYSEYKYPKKLKIFYDREALSQRWSEKILTHIDSDTCDKFIIVIGDNTLNFTDEDRSPKMVNFYEDLAKSPRIEALAKIKKYKKENPNKRVDYMRLEIARALQKSNVNIVPLCLYRDAPIEIQDLKLPSDISELENYQGVSYHNHRSNTSPITTIFPDIDRHLFSEKFKPYNNIFRYIMSILSKNWQWTITILALICVLGMWLQRSSGIMPNLKLPKTDKAVTSIDNKNAAEVHKYVDLGLSVKWATCNLGAYSLIEKGSTFSWGEVMRGKYHNWESYKYSEGNSSYVTKYCDNEVIGVNDRKTTLELSDDAAYVNWGTDWRIPTEKEFIELINECSWKLDSINNVKGYQVIGKNGNSIFLPFCERISHSARKIGYTMIVTVETHVSAEGEGGYYWTSSVDVNNPQKARGCCINSNICGMSNIDRYMGLYIRPVYCGK